MEPGDIGELVNLYVAINKSAGKIHPVVGIKSPRDVYGSWDLHFLPARLTRLKIH